MNEQLQDQMLRFGGGSDITTLAVGTAIFVTIAVLMMFLLPKKYAVLPYLYVSLFIPYSQVVVLGGLHFNVYRILLPFVWIRALTGRRDDVTEKFRLSGIDKVVLLWAFADALCASLQWAAWGAVVNRLGFLYNVLGIYFALRLLIRTREDVNRVVKSLAFACVFLAVFMIYEQRTGRNLFSVFGGVSEFTAVRDGKIRSQAAFAHAIVAGTVGANLLPLFVGLWWQKEKSKKLAAAGVIAALVMVVTCSSATPVGAIAGAIAALCLWTFRHSMRILRWGIVAVLVGLNMVMKAPVWALIERINIVGGNSGYHRYELVNQAILHFGQWWLVGFQNPSSWGYEMGDVSNAYVSAAVEGGLLTLIFFICIFWQSYRYLGLAREAAEREGDRKLELQIWSFGAALTATLAAYFGITYFDQSILVWWALLAMIGAITSTALAKAPATEPAPANAAPAWMRGRVPLGARAKQPALRTETRLGAVGLPSDKMRLPDWQRR